MRVRSIYVRGVGMAFEIHERRSGYRRGALAKERSEREHKAEMHPRCILCPTWGGSDPRSSDPRGVWRSHNKGYIETPGCLLTIPERVVEALEASCAVDPKSCHMGLRKLGRLIGRGAWAGQIRDRRGWGGVKWRGGQVVRWRGGEDGAKVEGWRGGKVLVRGEC